MSTLLANTVEKIKSLESQFDHLHLTRARTLAKDHEPQTEISYWHNLIGGFIAGTFAVGCGVTGVAAMVASIPLTGFAFWAMVAVLGVASPFANWEMTKKDVPKILSLGFVKLFKTEGPTLSLEGIELVHGLTEDDIKKYIVDEFKKQDVVFDVTDFIVTKNKKNSNKIDFSFVIPKTHKTVSTAIMRHLYGLLKAETFHIEPSKFIPLRKRILLGFAAFLSIGFGTAIGALTFASVGALPLQFAAIGSALAAVGVATATVPYIFAVIGAIVGIITFACLSALMVKTFADAIKVPNLGLKISNLFKRRENESALQQGVRVTAIVVLGGGALLLSAYGVSTMLASCNIGFAAILNKIPGAFTPAVTISSTVITQGIAFFAQVPFMIKTSFGTIAGAINRFSTPKAVEPLTEKAQTEALISRASPKAAVLVKQLAASAVRIVGSLFYVGAFLCNAIANAILSLNGSLQNAGMSAWSVMAAIGGAINSFFATFGNALAGENPAPASATKANAIANSTNAIQNGLSINALEVGKPLLVAANDSVVTTNYGSFNRNHLHLHGAFETSNDSNSDDDAKELVSPVHYNKFKTY